MHNGVLGDILHVILTPSTSEDESLMDDYYDAELMGAMKLCRYFDQFCPKSLLDFVSVRRT